MHRLTWLNALLIFSSGLIAGLQLPAADHSSHVQASIASVQLEDTRQEAAKTKPVAYVASKLRDPFHYPTCKWAAKISPANLQTFKTRKEAIQAGHRPCKVCRP